MSAESVASYNSSTRRGKQTRLRQQHEGAKPVPLAQPIRNRDTRVKTLYEIAAEREQELLARANGPVVSEPILTTQEINHAVQRSSINRKTRFQSIFYSEPPRDRDRPFLTAALYASTLTMCHFTLNLIVHQQFAQLDMLPSHSVLAMRSITQAFPILFMIVYLAHHETLLRALALNPSAAFRTNAGFVTRHMRNFVLCVIASVASTWVLRVNNEERYLAVLEKAPAITVMWIWAFMEMPLGWCIINVVVLLVALYMKGWAMW